MKFFGCFGRSGYAYAPLFEILDLEQGIMTVELCGSFCYAADMKIAGNGVFPKLKLNKFNNFKLI